MPKLKIFAFSRYRFDTREKALALIEWLAEGPFAPELFDAAEPVRRKLARSEWPQAADMLSGAPAHRGGTLFLQSKKPRATFVFAWFPAGTAEWYAEIDGALLARAGGRDKIVEFLAGLFGAFPVVFAGVSAEEDWNARHWVTEEDEDGGETTTKHGLDLRGCLPGVYWMTVFGTELVEHFGAARLRATSAAQAMDLGAGGMALVLETDPVAAKQRALTAEEDRLREAIGDEYFFDLTRRDRRCTPVPGVSDSPPA
jgi:hypothetical protein